MSFINRELSWLEFNQRVLDEALRKELPLLERLKFLSITGSNMDEFFQIRVGGLQLLQSAGSGIYDTSGLTPSQQLAAIGKRAQVMSDDQYDLLNDDILPELKKEGIQIIDFTEDELSPTQIHDLSVKFKESIFPLLTPLAYFPDAPAPSLPAMKVIVACELQNPEDQETRIAFIPAPEGVQRFIQITPLDAYIPLENVIVAFAEELFPDETLVSSMPFRITRNRDIPLQEEDVIDLAGEMEGMLAARKYAKTVRIEYLHSAPSHLSELLKTILDATEDQIYKIRGPLAILDFMSLAASASHDHLCNPSWVPQPSPDLDPSVSICDTLTQRDLLLHHPYESFEPVLRFLEEAAVDPFTVAIKQVLYRTAPHSRIIESLIKAAQNGKQVTVLIELKARFDEAQNLLRADELQRAGVQVVYGLKGLKTHAKICLVIRNEENKLKSYVHLGTGNYNEATARAYTDISYFTANPAYGADASLFFNAVTGHAKLTRFQKLIPAPTHMKQHLLDLISAEMKRAKKGETASITAKMNSLQDKEIIKALCKAAKHGVTINLNIRGVCCLKTGTENGLENISVVSVIDRYLEHSRIFSFHNENNPLVYISSADWMTRNLDKRVELMIPIEDHAHKKRLLGVLKAAFEDNQNGFQILPDGTSIRILTKKGQKKSRMQKKLQQHAKKIALTDTY